MKLEIKNIKRSVALSLMLILALGCNPDRLEVDPVGEFLSENFLVSEEQVYSALIAAYDPMGWSMAFGQWISTTMYGEVRSDNANAGGDLSNNDQPGWQELDDFNNNNTNTVTHPIYRRCYIGIFRSNLVINNVELESPTIDRYIAEAKFLRAYYHYELFKFFGPIPVVTDLLAPGDVNLERNTMTEVMTSVVSDLEAAIELLPVSVSANEFGRASKGMAQALLAEALIFWADLDNDNPTRFAQAADLLREVVNSGVYQLEDDMRDLYALGAKGSVESVFEIQHSNLYPSDWSWFEGIDGNGLVQLCGVRGLCADHPFLEAGWGFMLPTQDLYDHYLDDDLFRRSAAIISVADLEEDIEEANITTCPVVVDVTQSNPVDYTGYWQGKINNYKGYEGNNVNGGDPNLTKDANTYVIRYAEVLLLLAEAVHRSGQSDAEAMGYIDQVRERAAGPGDNTGNFRTAQEVMNEEGWDLMELIWYERRAELAMEGDRWFDLVRSGRATASLFEGDPIRENNFDEDDLWLPISFEETSVAPRLTTYPDPSLFN